MAVPGMPRERPWIKLVRCLERQTSQGCVLPAFIHSGPSIHRDVLPACLPSTYMGSRTSCAVGAADLAYRSENTWLAMCCYEQQPPESLGVICPLANGAYRLEAFLFSISLKHSNLNLKCKTVLAPTLVWQKGPVDMKTCELMFDEEQDWRCPETPTNSLPITELQMVIQLRSLVGAASTKRQNLLDQKLRYGASPWDGWRGTHLLRDLLPQKYMLNTIVKNCQIIPKQSPCALKNLE